MLKPVNAQRDQCLLERHEALSMFAAREIQPDTRKIRVTTTGKDRNRSDNSLFCPASLISEKGMDSMVDIKYFFLQPQVSMALKQYTAVQSLAG